MKAKRNHTMAVAVIGISLVILIFSLGTIWIGRSAKNDTDDAVRSVSLFYLNELAGRREQVVNNNLQGNIEVIHTAIELMTEDDLSDKAHLAAYQSRMKKLFKLDKFAFVDTEGLIYTSLGTESNIDAYHFDYRTLTGADISVLSREGAEKQVIIAVPVDLSMKGKHLSVCFMAINMSEMLAGISMDSQSSDSTFSNLYASDGSPLTSQVLGGLAAEDNLLEALRRAEFDNGSSREQVISDFAEGRSGAVSFRYSGTHETLSYTPVSGTDWLLTYLIRESVITSRIGSVSNSILQKSVIQSVLTVLVLLAMFLFIIHQIRKNSQLELEKETADAENRIKQEEIERRLALQDALKAALDTAEAANKAKTTFLSNMSHEIRTPMNAIIGLDNIALSDPGISDRTREHLTKIGVSANHLLSIINDILDMSRIESGRMVIRNEEFSFPKLLEQVNTIISGQCRDKDIEYTCRTSGKIDEYYIGDDMKLRQVMINILGNAVKFTPSGGKVTFLVEEMARYDGKATLRLTFSDTGIGMSKEYLPKLFEAFTQEDSSTTSKYGSTGLGMPITKSIVELMNGHIEVESEKGKGTTFTVTVTLTESAHSRETRNMDSIRPGDMNVLVIDDDPIACEHAKVVLGQVGISCETASSGREALEMVNMHHARRSDYHLILVDWKMPEMDGLETTREIRSILGTDTPIIILTSYNWDEIVEEARAAGVDTFVAKPLFAGTVLDEFRDAFDRKSEAQNEIKADLEGRRVLLAEDVEVNADIMVMVLAMRGVTADVAENGRIALEKFSAQPEGTYDAILMDMRMPEMDGLEATRAIRALDRADSKTVPIIALTANAFDEDVQRSLQAGLNAHLSKPVDPDTLFETLESLIKP